MSSKVGGVDSTSTAALSTGRSNTQRSTDAASGGAQASGGSSGKDDVQITGSARNMASLEQAVRDMPAVNSAKVAQISSAIEQGTYTVNSQHIADRLMQMDKELARLPGAQDADAESEPE